MVNCPHNHTKSSERCGPRHPPAGGAIVAGGIGRGKSFVAGLFAALCAATEGRVLVLAKGPLRSSTSSLAQGGIAAALSADDTPRSISIYDPVANTFGAPPGYSTSGAPERPPFPAAPTIT